MHGDMYIVIPLLSVAYRVLTQCVQAGGYVPVPVGSTNARQLAPLFNVLFKCSSPIGPPRARLRKKVPQDSLLTFL